MESNHLPYECVLNIHFTNECIERIHTEDIPTQPYVLPSSTICIHYGTKKFYRETKGFCCCDGRVKLQLHNMLV